GPATTLIAGRQLLGGTTQQAPHAAWGNLQSLGDHRNRHSLMGKAMDQLPMRRGDGSWHSVLLESRPKIKALRFLIGLLPRWTNIMAGLPGQTYWRVTEPPPLRPAIRRRFRIRRWATAAAVLLLLLGGFGFTEAIGVTNVRGTVL